MNGKSKRANDCETLLTVLRKVKPASALLLREFVPLGATQRISDLRRSGYVIKCNQRNGSVGGLYTLLNPNHRRRDLPMTAEEKKEYAVALATVQLDRREARESLKHAQRDALSMFDRETRELEREQKDKFDSAMKDSPE